MSQQNSSGSQNNLGDFINEFCPRYTDYEIYDKLDELIYKLSPETGKPWNIKSLILYLDFIYQRASSLHNNVSQYEALGRERRYILKNPAFNVIDTTLLNNDYEKVYVIGGIDMPFLEFGNNDKIIKYLENDFGLSRDNQVFEKFKKIKPVVFFTEKEDLPYLFESPEEIIFPSNPDDNIKELRKNDLSIILNSPSDGDAQRARLRVDTGDNFKLHGISHIVIDGSENLPLSFLNAFLGKNYYYLDKYQIQHDIINDEKAIESLKNIIKRAVENTLRRHKTDGSLIAPMYYAKLDRLSYILPLYITHEQKPDCVLLFNKKEAGGYVAATLLNMNEAYMDARLLGTVDKYPWLL
jgi:hypothetical protein